MQYSFTSVYYPNGKRYAVSTAGFKAYWTIKGDSLIQMSDINEGKALNRYTYIVKGDYLALKFTNPPSSDKKPIYYYYTRMR